jgi:uncharacterized MAPEG superfamily protein
MEQLWASESFRIYAASLLGMLVNVFVLAGAPGIARLRGKGTVNPEDMKTFGATQAQDPADAERALRAHRNFTENAWIYVSIGLCFVVSGGSASAMKGYAAVWVISRLLHTVFYLGQMQPWRTIAFAVSMSTIVGMAVQIGMALAR